MLPKSKGISALVQHDTIRRFQLTSHDNLPCVKLCRYPFDHNCNICATTSARLSAGQVVVFPLPHFSLTTEAGRSPGTQSRALDVPTPYNPDRGEGGQSALQQARLVLVLLLVSSYSDHARSQPVCYSSENLFFMAPGISSWEELLWVSEEVDEDTGDFKYIMFATVEDDMIYYGQLNRPKAKISFQDAAHSLARIPDDEIFPRWPQGITLTKAPQELPLDVFIKRPRLALYDVFFKHKVVHLLKDHYFRLLALPIKNHCRPYR